MNMNNDIEESNYKDEDIAIAFDLIAEGNGLETRMAKYVEQVARGYGYRYTTAKANLQQAYLLYSMIQDEEEMAHCSPEQIYGGFGNAIKTLELLEENSIPGGLSNFKNIFKVGMKDNIKMLIENKRFAKPSKVSRAGQLARIINNPKYGDLIAENPYFKRIIEELEDDIEATLPSIKIRCITGEVPWSNRSSGLKLDSETRRRLMRDARKLFR